MPTLEQCLAALPHRDLRGVATRLRVRRRGEHGKMVWIEAILQAWSTPARQSVLLARLSPAALAAATRLAQAGELPGSLFLAEYGAVRRPQPGQHWQPPPWAAPQTVSEELYYAGLLAASPPAALEKAQRLALPADLRPLFLAQTTPALPTTAPDAPAPVAAALWHDVAQTLCFLAELAAPGSAPVPFLRRRWLAPTALADLNRRLLQPEPRSPPRSHARAPRLRLLFFLTAAAGLQAASGVTAAGWAWLAEPPLAQLSRLWAAWRAAPLALRQVYRQPTARLPAPWPELALSHLPGLPPTFTAAQLAQIILGQEPAYTAYFTAHLPHLTALDGAVAELLETLVVDWGAFVPTRSPDANAAATFTWTPVGRWLLDPAHPAAVAPVWPPAPAPAARLTAAAAGVWQLAVSPWAPPLPLARLAVYARHVDLTPSAPPSLAGKGAGGIGVCHIYRLNEATVAAAAAAGHGLPTLLDGLAGLGVQLDSAQLAVLQAWQTRGHELQLTHLPLLRAARPELLAQLLGCSDVRAGLGDLLSPTVAIAALPAADLAARLRAAGYFPQVAGVREQEAGARNQESGDSDQGMHSATTPQSLIPNPQFPAALWLAGQLYAAVGEHVTLPLPPPFVDLSALLAALPPADQAVVQAQWETLRGDLLALLDGRTFAPPPTPADPARWRPLIEAAIAAGRPLTMRYFTAGRNLLTARTVTPYWIEDHRGILYLRADCHLAGQVRLFRLDRIQEIQESGNREQESVTPPPPCPLPPAS